MITLRVVIPFSADIEAAKNIKETDSYFSYFTKIMS